MIELNHYYTAENQYGYALFNNKELVVKYLPLKNQIIAIKSDMNESKMILKRLHERLEQLVFQKKVVDEAQVLIKKTNDGSLLCKNLLELVGGMHNAVSKSDLGNRFFLDDIRERIMQVDNLYLRSLHPDSNPAVKKPGLAIVIFVGGFAMLMLVIAILLSKKVFIDFKNSAGN